MRSLISFTIVSALASPATHARAAEPEAPLDVVRGLVESIRSFERSEGGEPLSPIQEQKNRRTTESAHAALDFDGLARRSLGDTWQKLSEEKRRDFVALLKRLFAEVAYPSSSEFFGALEIDYTDAGLRGAQHVIAAEVSHPDEGLVDLEFHLEKVDGRWKVVDLHLDMVSLALDIRSQMQRIISDDGYEALLSRMKKKLDEEGVSAGGAKAEAPAPE